MTKQVEGIDQIYCINLDRRLDRWQKMDEQFKKLNMKVERLSAIDGKSTFNESSYRSGVYGCFASHVNVLEDAVRRNFRSVIVIEDDAVLHPNFQDIVEKSLTFLPNEWKLCYLGGSNIKPPKKLHENISICTETLSTVGYMVNVSFAREILIPRLKKSLGTIEIDAELTKAQRDFTFHVLDPRVVYQFEDYSDIQHKNVNYSHQKDF